MADQSIVDYIRENLKKGVKPDDIRIALLDSGWPQAEIDAGMAQAGAGQAPAGRSPVPPSVSGAKDEKQKKGHKRLIISLIVLAILVFVFLYVAASIVQGFNSMFPGSMDSINGILSGGGTG